MAASFLKVGYNFTSDLLEYIIDTRRTSTGNIISEVYGSRSESSALSARPKFRIPNVSRNDFRKHVQKLHDAGISFDYTLNTSSLGAKQNIAECEREIKEYIRFLIDSGVGTITVTLPIMASFVRDISFSVKLELSTIAGIETVTQAKIWKDEFDINKICCNLSKNRDFAFLRALSNYCHGENIELILIANEFCGNGVYNTNSRSHSATSCIFRDHCYLLHSLDYEKADILPNDYPMGYCIGSRSDAAVWLKMNFIRPEDLPVYNSIGISHFKITGRTGTTPFIKKVTNAYIQGTYSGNLLELWKHLETISCQSDSTFIPIHVIPNDQLNGFIDYWANSANHNCANEVCGITCRYCDDYYERICSSI